MSLWLSYVEAVINGGNNSAVFPGRLELEMKQPGHLEMSVADDEAISVLKSVLVSRLWSKSSKYPARDFLHHSLYGLDVCLGLLRAKEVGDFILHGVYQGRHSIIELIESLPHTARQFCRAVPRTTPEYLRPGLRYG